MKKKRLKKKELKLNENNNNQNNNNNNENNNKEENEENKLNLLNIEVEYVSADLSELEKNPTYEEFKKIFEKFTNPEELTKESNNNKSDNNNNENEENEDDNDNNNKENNNELINNEDNEPIKKLSKKKKRLMSRLSVAELKQLVQRPDVVEAHDVTSSDPRLLVFLKAMKNTVPVPRHWCHKRKYLQGKRGIEKPPFRLPEYIADTGIARIRESVLESESLKKSKQKARDKLQPKMGKIDIDYQVLHDAFFKYQTKPKLTEHGDLYYEGKEFEVDMKEKKPGILSPELIAALGMSEGSPPPWLVNMQRYGPPPSYPHLRIPGLNAPIPDGASYGYHPGGWGKPPVDEYGRPLYGDVFGTYSQMEKLYAESIDKSHWGELGAISSDSEGEGSEEELEEDDDDESSSKFNKNQYNNTNTDESGMETPMTLSGISSVASGLETPSTVIDLRKREGGTETPEIVLGKDLYQVIQEKKSNQVGGSGGTGHYYGSERTYVIPGKNNENDTKESGQQSTQSNQSQSQNNNNNNNNKGNDDDYDDEDKNSSRSKRKRKGEASSVTKKQKDFRF